LDLKAFGIQNPKSEIQNEIETQMSNVQNHAPGAALNFRGLNFEFGSDFAVPLS